MKFFGLNNYWFKSGIFLVFSVWAAAAVYFMYRNYFFISPPPEPSPFGGDAYGTNSVGAFEGMAIFLLIEYLIVLAVLILFPFNRFYWIGALILQAVFGGWLFILVLGAMHSGGVYMIHLLAIFALNILISIIFLTSLAAIFKESRQSRVI